MLSLSFVVFLSSFDLLPTVFVPNLLTLHHYRGRGKRPFDQVNLDTSTAAVENANKRLRSQHEDIDVAAIYDQFNVCPSCHKNLYKPCTLPCGYTVCSVCLQDQQSSQQPCQQCERVHISPIQPNVLVQQLQDIINLSLKRGTKSVQEEEEEKQLHRKLRAACECSICCHRLKHASTTPCGHTFCRHCLMRSLDYQRQCPFCREPIQFCSPPTNLLISILSLLEEDSEENVEEEQTSSDATETRVPLLIGSVAFPHIRCALHIFEARYRLMLRRIMSSDRKRLAICSAHRLPSAPTPFYEYGTMLELTHVQILADGRFIVEAIGSHRFKVIQYDLIDGYHMAKIERIDDIDPEQEALLEQRQILKESAKRARQQQQQQQSLRQQQQSLALHSSERPSQNIMLPLSMTAQPPASSSLTPRSSLMSPVSMARPSHPYPHNAQYTPLVGQRRSWAEQTHPETRPQISRAPWLQMHMRGLTAARQKSALPSSTMSGAPTSGINELPSQPQLMSQTLLQPTFPITKSPKEHTTEELIDQIANFIEKVRLQTGNNHPSTQQQLQQQQSMSHWLNALTDPPTPLRGPERDNVIFVWWVINMIPISEDEKAPILSLITLRERVLKVLSCIAQFEDQWSFFLHHNSNSRSSSLTLSSSLSLASSASSTSTSATPSSCCIS